MGDLTESLDKSEVQCSNTESARAQFPLDDCEISSISDETLAALFNTAPVIHSYEGTRIVRLSQTLVLKGGINARPCEANILNLMRARGRSTIAVPNVYRVLKVETENVYFGCKCLFVMDFIEGSSVQECWEHLSEAERVDVVTQVASMITALHSIPVPQQQPGPVGCRTCLARGFWFTDMGAGPFGSKEELEAWFNHKLTICKNFKQAPETVPPFHFDKLVLTHQDIAPRNLILGPDRKVWLIDWGDAGVYPEGFEVASLKTRRFSAPVFTDMLLEMIPRPEIAQQLEWIMFALTTGQYL
ncbi:hypothetical protein AJ78_01692 [Emergomyces pasteurianus Ep9510]|uniref:Protein kinase domain-containing protein n=1 Tax=Emergomyces pasteurianus Ep9510 TaxID=1447872 RepID=A0A1J9QSK8_9EURO|nr:hypothetical protein AJ78_01692 [Emergomyces pasteurianus Ep9510]